MKIILASLILVSISVSAKTRKFDIVDGAGQVVGLGTIKPNKEGSQLIVELKKAEPGIKAMHIHENGKCEGPQFTTAGGHFNPTGKKHGHGNPEGAHIGDLDNIEISAKGTAKKTFMLKGLGFEATSDHSLETQTGTSLIIHAKADDNKTDPSGNAGDRIYCGVISASK